MASVQWMKSCATTCRRVAAEVDSASLRAILLEMADEYDHGSNSSVPGLASSDPSGAKPDRHRPGQKFATTDAKL
jgi:hypothetical protein